jgi:hypothetical protein
MRQDECILAHVCFSATILLQMIEMYNLTSIGSSVYTERYTSCCFVQRTPRRMAM